MSKAENELISLIKAYLCGELDTRQRAELNRWLEEKEEHKLFLEQISTGKRLRERWEWRQKIDVEKAIQKFDRRTGKNRRISFISGKAQIAVAVVVLVTFILTVFYKNLSRETTPVITESIIASGQHPVILVLAGGKQVELSANDSLQVNLKNGGKIVSRNKQLVYKSPAPEIPEYNELRVPRGGEYSVILADGTHVRLNSGSTLKYPVAFRDGKRKVALTGEAYFQVAKDARRPFYVQMDEMTVRVYGTAFNVNTQDENRILTALVEGKVGIVVKGAAGEFLMKPSQLAEFNRRTKKMDIRTVDLAPYVAWVNQLFVFEDQRLEDIMNTVSLWYDRHVFYKDPALKDLHFTGTVKRYEKIDYLLDALQQTVKVKIERNGQTIIIGH